MNITPLYEKRRCFTIWYRYAAHEHINWKKTNWASSLFVKMPWEKTKCFANWIKCPSFVRGINYHRKDDILMITTWISVAAPAPAPTWTVAPGTGRKQRNWFQRGGVTRPGAGLARPAWSGSWQGGRAGWSSGVQAAAGGLGSVGDRWGTAAGKPAHTWVAPAYKNIFNNFLWMILLIC